MAKKKDKRAGGGPFANMESDLENLGERIAQLERLVNEEGGVVGHHVGGQEGGVGQHVGGQEGGGLQPGQGQSGAQGPNLTPTPEYDQAGTILWKYLYNYDLGGRMEADRPDVSERGARGSPALWSQPVSSC